MKLIARIFAETGIRDLFQLLHMTIRKHGSKAQIVKLRNQWVQVNPRDWKTRDDMTVKVGLGDGSKQEQLAGTQLLIGAQEKAIAAGMVSPKNLYNSAKVLCKLLGHKNVEEYFTAPGQKPDPQDPASAPIPPPQDPKQAEIAAKAAAEREKIKADAAHAQMKTQGDIAHQKMKTEADIALQQHKAQTEIAMQDRKMQVDVAAQERKMQFEMALAQQKFELDKQLKLIDAGIRQEQHEQALQQRAVEHSTKIEQMNKQGKS